MSAPGAGGTLRPVGSDREGSEIAGTGWRTGEIGVLTPEFRTASARPLRVAGRSSGRIVRALGFAAAVPQHRPRGATHGRREPAAVMARS
jgi:hypothetical protein